MVSWLIRDPALFFFQTLCFPLSAERVWVVWSSTWLTTQSKRWKSPLYLLCIGSESLYSVVVTLALLMGITDSGFKCYIGIHIEASLLLLGYDWYVRSYHIADPHFRFHLLCRC